MSTEVTRETGRPGSRGYSSSVLLAALLILLLGGAAWAQSEEVEELREAVEEQYEVLRVEGGIRLESLEPSEVEWIELTRERIAVDGETVDAEELPSLLGEGGELIARLAELEPEERLELFDLEDEEEIGEEGLSERERLRRIRRRVRRATVTSDAKVSVGSSVTVDEDEVARDVVAIGGSLDVEGEVLGDAVAIGGPVRVSGKVTGDVVSVGGTVYLDAGAEVLGGVTSVGGTVEREEGATILGPVSEVAFAPGFTLDFEDWWPGIDWDRGDRRWSPFRFGDAMDAAWSLMGLVVLALLVSLVLLVASNPVERVREQAVSEPWKAGLVGLAVQVLFLPVLIVVIVILCISIIGIPLLILVPFAVLALCVGALLGYTGVAYGVGHWANERFGWKQESPYLVLLIGVAAIQALSFLGDLLDLGGGPLFFFAVMVSLVGFLVKYAAWTVGLGAVFLTRFGTAGKTPALALPPAPAPPAPEPPPEATPAPSNPQPGEGGEGAISETKE